MFTILPQAGLEDSENISASEIAHRLSSCRTGLFTTPQRHETDGVVLLGFKISPCYGDATQRINTAAERSSRRAQQKAIEGLERSDPAKKAAEAVGKEGQSTSEGKETKQHTSSSPETSTPRRVPGKRERTV